MKANRTTRREGKYLFSSKRSIEIWEGLGIKEKGFLKGGRWSPGGEGGEYRGKVTLRGP